MPATVGLRGSAGNAEVPDERLAHGELLLLGWQPQRLACGVQASGVAAVEAVQHRVPPLVLWQQVAIKLREAVPLERCVVGVLDVLRAFHGLVEPIREHFSLRQIHNLYRAVIYAVCEQQDFKVGALHVLVGPCLANRHTAEGFKVNAEVVNHSSHLSPAITSAYALNCLRCLSIALYPLGAIMSTGHRFPKIA